MNPLAFLTGLSNTIKMAMAVVAAASITFGVMRVYDSMIDDPAVAAEAKRGLVAVVELAKAEAERDAQVEITAALRRLAAGRERLAREEAKAREAFEAKFAEADAINTQLQVNIDEILSAPPSASCDLGRVRGRLRNP